MDFIKPEKLVRYRRFNDKSIEELISGELWVSSCKSFNDPFDCNLDIKNTFDSKRAQSFYWKAAKEFDLKSAVSEFHFLTAMATIPESAEEFRHFIREVLNDVASNFGMLCFSDSEKIGLLWSHYAESHKGFCVEYDVDPLCSGVVESKDFELRKVEYDACAYITYEEIEKFLIDKTSRSGPEVDAFIRKILITKDVNWKYEREWRFITPRRVDSFIKFPSKIKKIYFGFLMPEWKKKTIVNLLSGRGVEFFSMNREECSFNVQAEAFIS